MDQYFYDSESLPSVHVSFAQVRNSTADLSADGAPVDDVDTWCDWVRQLASPLGLVAARFIKFLFASAPRMQEPKSLRLNRRECHILHPSNQP